MNALDITSAFNFGNSCHTASSDSANQPIRLQQPNLPDLETHLHIQHAELIADVEKSLLLMQNFLAVVVSDCC